MGFKTSVEALLNLDFFFWHANHPYFIGLACLFLFSLFCFSSVKRLEAINKLSQWTSGGLVAFWCLMVVHYLGFPKFMDHGESHVASIGLLAWKGFQLYPGPLDSQDFGNYYGPWNALIYGFLPWIGIKTFWAAKIPGVITFLISCGLFIFAKTNPSLFPLTRKNWIISAILVLAFFENAPYFSRPDPLLLCLVLTIHFLILRKNINFSQIVFAGALAGIAINIKPQAAIHLLPISLVLFLHARAIQIFQAVLSALLFFFAPYLVFKFSLSNQYQLIFGAVGQGRDWNAIITLFVPQFIFLTLPFWFSKVPKILKIATAFSGALIVLIAAKPGAGSYQYLPLVASTWYFVGHFGMPKKLSEFRSKKLALIQILPATFLVSLFLGALPIQFKYLKQMRGNAQEPVLEDLKYASEILKSQFKILPNQTSLGWGDGSHGDNYYLSFYRPWFIWQGAPYDYDLGIQMDMRYMNRNLSPAGLQPLIQCHSLAWLIPKDEVPFQFPSFMTRLPMYPQEFVKTFYEHYSKVAQTRYFDIWSCKTQSASDSTAPGAAVPDSG